MADALLAEAETIAADSRSRAPRTRRPSYRPSIETGEDVHREMAAAYVTADRHEMVIEYGWKDRAGTAHPGLFVLTGALRRRRVSS